jgi:hypothetical protein
LNTDIIQQQEDHNEVGSQPRQQQRHGNGSKISFWICLLSMLVVAGILGAILGCTRRNTRALLALSSNDDDDEASQEMTVVPSAYCLTS